jgi:hypothetical protein
MSDNKIFYKDLQPGDLVIAFGERARMVLSIEQSRLTLKVTWFLCWGYVEHPSKIYSINYAHENGLRPGDCHEVVRHIKTP